MCARFLEGKPAGALFSALFPEGHLSMAEYTNSFDEFERASIQPPQQVYRLRLYVTGASRSSLVAIANLKQFCRRYLDGRYELEVVDLYQQPELATQEQLFVAPTLVKTHPPPTRRMIGTLSNPAEVMRVLDLYVA
jgi:circadian clock protein KaiB